VISVTLSDLLEAGLIHPDERIEWRRPQLGEFHHATIAANGSVITEVGSYTSLSSAADAH
jgi:hypothetical protein